MPIRPFTSDEGNTLLDEFRSQVDEMVEAVPSRAESESFWDRASTIYAAFKMLPEWYGFVAEDSRGIHGAVSYTILDDAVHVMRLGSLKKGVGTRLLNKVEDIAKRKKLSVKLTSSHSASGFYEKKGYRGNGLSYSKQLNESKLIRQLLLETFLEDDSKPHLDHKWISREVGGQTLDRLTVSWRLHGATSVYNALPWKDAIGTIVVEHHPNIATEPGFMFVESIHVAKEWRRKGLGRKLYQEASRIAKERGYKGVASDSTGRSNDASSVWSKIEDRRSGDWSLLEVIVDTPESLKESASKGWYHGGTYEGGRLTRPIYFTKNQDMAKSYVMMSEDRDGEGAIVREFEIAPRYTATEDTVLRLAQDAGMENIEFYTPASCFDDNIYDEREVQTLVSSLLRKGYDSAICEDISYGGNIQEKVLIVLDGSIIKREVKENLIE